VIENTPRKDIVEVLLTDHKSKIEKLFEEKQPDPQNNELSVHNHWKDWLISPSYTAGKSYSEEGQQSRVLCKVSDLIFVGGDDNGILVLNSIDFNPVKTIKV